MASKKLLNQQKTRRTLQVQENLKEMEDELFQLKPLQSEPPEYLDETATQEWYRIVDLLDELPIADLDMSLVSAYCQTYSNYVQATKHLNKHGLVTETERGTKLSSYYTAQRDSTDRLISLSNKLGLNLDSRMRVMSPSTKKKDDDVMSDFFDD